MHKSQIKGFLNRPELYFLLSRTWEGFYQISVMFVVTTLVSPSIQGYYFTFLSLSSFGLVIEGGVGFVMLQFMSHEWARLKFTDNGIVGDEQDKKKLAQLFNFFKQWYIILATVVPIALFALGFLVFRDRIDGVSWAWPWALLTFGFGVQVLSVGLRVSLEAASQLILVNKVSIISGFCAGLCVALHVLNGPNLYLPGIYVTSRAMLQIMFFWGKLKSIRELPGEAGPELSWRQDIWPLQIRVLVSTATGFCLFQIPTTLSFMVAGPSAAGAVGMMIQIYMAINMFASPWIYVAQPTFGALIANNETHRLSVLYKKTLQRSIITCVMLCFIVAGVVSAMTALGDVLPRDRIGSWASFFFLFIAVVAQQRSNVETSLVRMHQVEPFVFASVMSATVMSVCIYLTAKTGSADIIIIGFCLVLMLILFPWVTMIAHQYVKRLSS